MEKHYTLELSETVNNLIKMKEIHELNDIRVGELKQIIDDGEKKYQIMVGEAEMLKTNLI